MLSDKDLNDVYQAGFHTDHLTGLKAVWAAAQAAVLVPAPEGETVATPEGDRGSKVAYDPPVINVDQIVEYYPSNGSGPYPGTVDKVWSYTCVNLKVDTPDGMLEPTSVFVYDPTSGGERPSGHYCVPVPA